MKIVFRVFFFFKTGPPKSMLGLQTFLCQFAIALHFCKKKQLLSKSQHHISQQSWKHALSLSTQNRGRLRAVIMGRSTKSENKVMGICTRGMAIPLFSGWEGINIYFTIFSSDCKPLNAFLKIPIKILFFVQTANLGKQPCILNLHVVGNWINRFCYWTYPPKY